MDNAWQVQRPPTLASSSSSVASSIQVPSQMPRNQIETNNTYQAQLHDARQSQFQASVMNQVSLLSSTPDLGRCKGHSDIGSSFLALLSGPPQLQSDFSHLSNIKMLASSYPANFSSAPLSASSISIPNWRLTHDPRDHNPGSGVDVCPSFLSRFVASSRRSVGLASYGDQDTIRPYFCHAGPGQSDAMNVYLTKEGCVGSSNVSSNRMPHGSNSSTLQKSPPGLSPFHHYQPSTFMSSSRVFCMNKSGELLVSNAGLLAVVCSCHGLHMSISNFCEHSGLSNVVPGYAVRMDTGETIAQWRKMYFSKLGIRVPEDNRGWEWPEGHLSSVGVPQFSAPSHGGINGSGYSDMVCMPFDAVYPRRPYNDVFTGLPHPSHKPIAGVSQNDEPRNSYDQQNISPAGQPVNSKSNLHDMVDECVKHLGGIIAKAQANAKIGVVPERGATSSSIELKLGQPSEKCRTLEPHVFSTIPLRLNDPLKIISQEEIIHKIAAPQETDGQRHGQFDSLSSSTSRKEKQAHVNLSKHAFVASITDNVGNRETLHNDLLRNSRISKLPSHLATSSGAMPLEESSKLPNDSHRLIPWIRHFQHHDVRSAQINIADGTVRPSNSDKSDFATKMNKNSVAGNSTDNPVVASETSFRLYAKQMEKMGFFNRHNPESYQHVPMDGKKCNLFQLSSMKPHVLGNSRPPEDFGEKNCTNSARVEFIAPRKMNASMGFGATFPSQEFSMMMPSAMANLAQNLKSAVSNKNQASVGPSKLGERLRRLSLVDPAKPDQMNATFQSNEHPRLQNGGPDVKMRGSLLNLLPSEEQTEGHNIASNSSMPEFSSTIFSPVFSCQVDSNVRNSSSTSGANLKNLATHRNGFTSYSEEMSKHCHGCHDPLPNELPLWGTGNEAASRDACKKCSQREYNMRRCKCFGYMLCSDKESGFEGASSICSLKKHSLSSEAFKICASGISMDRIPAEKIISVENEKVTGLIHEELKSSISQWRDVPTKVKGDCKLMYTKEPAHGIVRRVKSGADIKDFSAENDFTSSKMDDTFKRKELSNASSGCSCPVRQVSVEVNKAVSSSVDTDVCASESDQVAYQGAVDQSLSSDDATVSQRSSEYLSSTGKTKSIRDYLSKSLYSDSHDLIHDHKQCNFLRMSEVQSHGLKCVKRKRRTKWRMLGRSFAVSGVSSSPSDPPSDRGNVAVQHYPVAKDGHMLPNSLKDSSDMHHACSQGRGSKRRKTALSLLERCSRKRDLDTTYDIGTVEDSNEKQLKNKPGSGHLPEIVAVKKLKQDNSFEANDKLRQQKVNFKNAGAMLKSNLGGCAKANYNKKDDSRSSKMKPVVCGMYGIISGRDNLLRLPKILSLSQVLKTARKCGDEPQISSVEESKKGSLDGRFYGSGNGNDSRCNRLQQNSRDLVFSLRVSNETSSDAHYTHPIWSVSGEQGLDKTKVNVSLSSSWTSSQFKPKFKAVRKRSLYELFMEGEKLSYKHLDDSKNTSCMLQEQCRSEMKASVNVGDSNQLLDHSSEERFMGLKSLSPLPDMDSSCCVCGRSNEDQTNCLLECRRCSVRIHQACYGIPRLPKGHWYCRPCSTNSVDNVCVLCGYGGGAMTRASRCYNVVKNLLKAWNIPTDSGARNKLASSEAVHATVDSEYKLPFPDDFYCSTTRSIVHNSVTAGLFDPTVKQWIHMVCGLWTPGTRCPNVDTMSSFDVSGVPHSKQNIVCVICKRPGGSCIRCRIRTCSSRFHPWCAHLKGLLQSEAEGLNNEKIGFYGRCMLHAMSLPCQAEAYLDSSKIKGTKEATCARIEGYKGRKQDGERYHSSNLSKGKGRCLVPQEQLNAWLHINRQNLSLKAPVKASSSDVEHDYKKEYARYKQMEGWKQLMVYKSAIHALGLYTSQLIPQGAMVVEYVGEIVGLRVADKREIEYQSGRKLQYKSACYFFRIDKEHIIDATRKGGIARFVNHSCMPNCVAKIIAIRNEKKVVFFAQRDIYPGEEITYDYHFNEDEGKKIPCLCNSRNCRRYLN